MKEETKKKNKKMSKEENLYKNVYPNLRHVLNATRGSYLKYKNMTSTFSKINENSPVVPDCYEVCNTNTVDSDITLNVLEGKLPKDITGNMYICQCLGTKDAFMVGDTNIVKINFSKKEVNLKNRFLWTPATMAKIGLENTKHCFDHMGLMFLSPGMGIYSYTEGMYLLPDGRLGITSDVDRPWIIDRENLKVNSPLGKRSQWLPMMKGKNSEVMGELFAGYSNSHVIYNDVKTDEVFLVNYQIKQADGTHPCNLMKFGKNFNIDKWSVVDENSKDILIEQSIHELIFTRDYIILADTAFAAGSEMIKPWKNAALPNPKTVIYIIARKDLIKKNTKVVAKRFEINEACIHLIADYENIDNKLKIYMLHTPATNTAEIIRSYDKDLNGKLFPRHLVGYGTLPVLDLSSLGKHTINMKTSKVSSKYIRHKKLTWGPYMYTYMGRQLRNLEDQDLFIMFKGFRNEILPKRIYNAYKNTENRRVPLDDMIKNNKINVNNSIVRLKKDDFKIADHYEFNDKVMLYTISCIETSKNEGYVLAGVVSDVKENELSSGHEYWLFDSNNLKAGPICKLGHKSLNNSVLFHTVYIPEKDEKRLDKNKIRYNVSFKEDYPAKDLKKYNKEVKEIFDEVIFPYYDDQDSKSKQKAMNILKEFSKNRVANYVGKEHIISEEEIKDAPKHAEKMIAEANRMFNSTGWKDESNKDGLLVQSKKVSGTFEKSGIFVTRATSDLDVNADKLFEYITSPEGYAVIDPVSDPNDHSKKPLEVYKWKKDSRLEAAVATTNIKMLDPSDFVVLNAIDKERKIFASKSIIHKSMKGSSKYYDKYVKPSNGHERALNTFVIQVEEISKNSCRVNCINYADMAGKTSSTMNNIINCKVFFPPLYKRMKEAINKIK